MYIIYNILLILEIQLKHPYFENRKGMVKLGLTQNKL